MKEYVGSRSDIPTDEVLKMYTEKNSKGEYVNSVYRIAKKYNTSCSLINYRVKRAIDKGLIAASDWR